MLHFYTASGIFEHRHPLKELFNALAGVKKRFVTNALNMPFDFLETKLGVGEGILLVAKKRS